jgi:hypothetical protein
LLFPLGLTGVRSALDERFGIVAGTGDTAAFQNVGAFLQQAPVATTLVSSTRSQRVAASSPLSPGRKIPLPWLVVDSQRSRNAQQWQAARPFLQLTREFRWDASSGSHVAELALGLDTETGRPGLLAEPIPLRFATRCKVVPAEATLKESGAAPIQLSIACSRKVKQERSQLTFGIRAANGALDWPLAIPRRPGPFELQSSAGSVLGLGLGRLEVTVVRTEEDRTPFPVSSQLDVPLQVDAGTLEPSSVTIPSGQAAVTASIRARGLGVMHISAGQAGLQSRLVSIRQQPPALFLGVTLLGGGVGGYCSARLARGRRERRRLRSEWRSVSGRVLEGALIGMALTGATLALGSLPAALHQSELAWFLGSVLAGFAGSKLLEILWAAWVRRRTARQISVSEA